MQKSSDGSNSFDEAARDNPRTGKPVIGGADNVQKTTYVVGQGTDPTAPDPSVAAARVSPGGGSNATAWIAGILAVLALLAYGAGVFS